MNSVEEFQNATCVLKLFTAVNPYNFFLLKSINFKDGVMTIVPQLQSLWGKEKIIPNHAELEDGLQCQPNVDFPRFM